MSINQKRSSLFQVNQPASKMTKINFSSEIYHFYYKNLLPSETVNLSEIYEKFPEIKSFNEILSGNSCLKRLYGLVVDNIQTQSYKDAIFYVDKLVNLTNNHPLIIYLLGECYYHNEDYKKVHSLFSKHKLLNYNQNFQILSARSLLKNKHYDICLNVLEMNLENPLVNSKLDSIKFLLIAQCHEANENKDNAKFYLFECLKQDPTCIEAFNRLIDCSLLTNSEKEQLLNSVNFNSEDFWIKKYFFSRIKEDYFDEKKITHPNKFIEHITDLTNDQTQILNKNQSQSQSMRKTSNSQLSNLKKTQNMEEETNDIANDYSFLKPDNLYETLENKNDIDILCIKAKNAHIKYDIAKAYEICVKTIKEDPLYFDIIPIYCACLLELNYLGELYYCAHNLIENYSNHPLSWFAIGAYYFLTKKYEIARKYFQKANILDRNFIYSWIGFGHSFAIQDESDQAMSVYRTCSRLFPGCYLAHLYIGMEYLRTNNLKTALLSFQYAKEINNNDPLIYNEIGVIYYKQKAYNEAKDFFLNALKICDNTISWIVETILSNLAHTYRKLKDFKNAIKFYEKCISLNAKNPYTYFSLAFTYHISNQLNKALSYYHKSIHFKYDNQFAHDMLAKCLTDAAEVPWDTVYNI